MLYRAYLRAQNKSKSRVSNIYLSSWTEWTENKNHRMSFAFTVWSSFSPNIYSHPYGNAHIFGVFTRSEFLNLGQYSMKNALMTWPSNYISSRKYEEKECLQWFNNALFLAKIIFGCMRIFNCQMNVPSPWVYDK